MYGVWHIPNAFYKCYEKDCGEQVNYTCRFFHFSFNITFKKKHTEISVAGQHPFSF